MPSVLVTYSSGAGQTARVAHRIGDALAERGFDVTTRHVWDTATLAVEDFDAVVVGASVRNRHHQPEVLTFVERHRDVLADRPTGFFQLSFASAVESEWARAGAREWVDQLVEETGWQPDAVGLFGGAVTYSEYGPVTRRIFQALSAVTTGGTDTGRTYEYTDWDDVDAFAEEFADITGRETGGLVPVTGPTPAGRLGTVALVALGIGAAYWLRRRRGRARQETLDDFDRDSPVGESPSAAETVDAAVGSSETTDLEGPDGDSTE